MRKCYEEVANMMRECCACRTCYDATRMSWGCYEEVI